MISAKVILDSISPQGQRLTTIEIVAHRYILAEINTHRMLSRNFRSSRAALVKRMIDEVRTNPARPISYGRNKPGMQATEELTGADLDAAKALWEIAAHEAANSAEALAAIGAHKQIVNRILEPFLYTIGVISATDWANFFALRLDKGAQPEMRALAVAMRKAMRKSTPLTRVRDEWHLPYLSQADFQEIELNRDRIKVSVARCARVSYRSFKTGKASTIEEDIKLHDRLLASGHMSPFEHVATPCHWDGACRSVPDRHGNFNGWHQWRKYHNSENRTEIPADVLKDLK